MRNAVTEFRTYLSYRRHAGDPSALSRYAHTSLAPAGISPQASRARVVSKPRVALNAARKEPVGWTAIQANWNRYKAAARRRWDRLTERQLHGTRGEHEYLCKRVQEAYALTPERAERQIAVWLARVLTGR